MNSTLICALGNPTAAGITSAQIDEAVSKAISDYTSEAANYGGGVLAGFDRFLTADRFARKCEDYLHLCDRETDDDI